MPRVAILIVTFQSEAEIGGCIDALFAHLGDNEAEIVVVDNASQDRTLDIAQQHGVRIIANENNRGFAAAVNQGMQATHAPLVLLLNPDAHLRTTLDALQSVFDDPRFGAAGGLLTHSDGSPQTGFTLRRLPSATALAFEALGINALLPRNPVNWQFRCYDLDLTKPQDAEQPPGGFLMFSRRAFAAAGGFDEQFWPIWFEDVDFCARLLHLGFRIRYVPQCSARHSGAHSISRLAQGLREKYWYGSLLKYAAKHYRPVAFRSICGAVAIGSMFRSIRTVQRQGLGGLAVHSAVVRHAVSRMLAP